MFDLEERLLDEAQLHETDLINAKVDALIQSGIDFDEIHQKIADYQKQSFEFLKKHLKHWKSTVNNKKFSKKTAVDRGKLA